MTSNARAKRPVHPVDEVLPAPKVAIYVFQHVLGFLTTSGAHAAPQSWASLVRSYVCRK